MLVVYPCGVLLLELSVLYVNRCEINGVLRQLKQNLETHHELGTVASVAAQNPEAVSMMVGVLAPMYQVYSPNFWWFGPFLLAVRILQTSALAFFSRLKVQATFACVISLVAINAQAHTRPFLKNSDSSVSYWATWLLFVWLSTLLLQDSGVFDGFPSVIIGSLLVILSVGVCVVTCALMIASSATRLLILLFSPLRCLQASLRSLLSPPFHLENSTFGSSAVRAKGRRVSTKLRWRRGIRKSRSHGVTPFINPGRSPWHHQRTRCTSTETSTALPGIPRARRASACRRYVSSRAPLAIRKRRTTSHNKKGRPWVNSAVRSSCVSSVRSRLRFLCPERART